MMDDLESLAAQGRSHALRHLVVTGDDFGLAPEVNGAIEAAHRSGTLSAASLMISGPAASDAVARARALPTLRVGLHLVLVDGKPVLPADRVPNLVDVNGCLRRDLKYFAAELLCRSELRRQLRAELVAQFSAYEESGLKLDHVDVHKNFHLHPVVAEQIISVGQQFGMPSLRVPREPRQPLGQIMNPRGVLAHELLRPWVAILKARAERAGLITADAVFGLAWSGQMTTARLVTLIEHLPAGFIEIYLHPAITDDFPGHAEGYLYRDEFEALRAPAVVAALQKSGFQLGGYSDRATLDVESATAG